MPAVINSFQAQHPAPQCEFIKSRAYEILPLQQSRKKTRSNRLPADGRASHQPTRPPAVSSRLRFGQTKCDYAAAEPADWPPATPVQLRGLDVKSAGLSARRGTLNTNRSEAPYSITL